MQHSRNMFSQCLCCSGKALLYTLKQLNLSALPAVPRNTLEYLQASQQPIQQSALCPEAHKQQQLQTHPLEWSNRHVMMSSAGLRWQASPHWQAQPSFKLRSYSILRDCRHPHARQGHGSTSLEYMTLSILLTAPFVFAFGDQLLARHSLFETQCVNSQVRAVLSCVPVLYSLVLVPHGTGVTLVSSTLVTDQKYSGGPVCRQHQAHSNR